MKRYMSPFLALGAAFFLQWSCGRSGTERVCNGNKCRSIFVWRGSAPERAYCGGKALYRCSPGKCGGHLSVRPHVRNWKRRRNEYATRRGFVPPSCRPWTRQCETYSAGDPHGRCGTSRLRDRGCSITVQPCKRCGQAATHPARRRENRPDWVRSNSATHGLQPTHGNRSRRAFLAAY